MTFASALGMTLGRFFRVRLRDVNGGKFGLAGISEMTLRCLGLEGLKATPVPRKPVEYFVVPGFVQPEARAKINADYPKISEGGSFPVPQLSYGPAFREFLAELESDDFREAFEAKFVLELAGRPTTTRS